MPFTFDRVVQRVHPAFLIFGVPAVLVVAALVLGQLMTPDPAPAPVATATAQAHAQAKSIQGYHLFLIHDGAKEQYAIGACDDEKLADCTLFGYRWDKDQYQDALKTFNYFIQPPAKHLQIVK